MKRDPNCVYRVNPNNILGKIVERVIGPRYKQAYFHRTGYSGNQKGNEVDICILELNNGQCITPPIDDVYRLIPRKDYIS